MSTTDRENTAAVFKAYDVRGTVPDQIDEVLARRTGAAFVAVVGAGEIAPERPCTKKALPSTAVVRAGSSQ